MNKLMLEDLVEIQKKKIKRLTIVVIILSALVIGLAIFAFSEFEIVYETEENYEITDEVTQFALAQENTNIIQNKNNTFGESEEKNSVPYMICGTVIVCVVIIVLGVIYVSKRSKK